MARDASRGGVPGIPGPVRRRPAPPGWCSPAPGCPAAAAARAAAGCGRGRAPRPTPPTTAEPTPPPTRKTSVAMPRATPRTSAGTASPTAAMSAGCPSPKASVTRTTAVTRTGADPRPRRGRRRRARRAAVTSEVTSERAGPRRASSGPASRGARKPVTALGTRASPTCSGVQPRAARTAGTAMSSANQAAGTAEAASALRTTTGSRMTAAAGSPRAAAHPGRDGGDAEPEQQRAGRRHHDARTAGDCTSSTRPAAVPATSAAPRRSSRAPVPCVGQRPPERGDDEEAERGQRDDRPPAGEVGHQATGQRTERAHRGRRPGDLPEGGGADGAVVAGADDGHAEAGTAAAPAPCSSRAPSSTSMFGAKQPSTALPAMSPTPTSRGSRMPARSAARP